MARRGSDGKSAPRSLKSLFPTCQIAGAESARDNCSPRTAFDRLQRELEKELQNSEKVLCAASNYKGSTSRNVCSAGSTSRNVCSAGYTSRNVCSAGSTSRNVCSAGYTSRNVCSAGSTSRNVCSAGSTSRNVCSAGSSNMYSRPICCDAWRPFNVERNDISNVCPRRFEPEFAPRPPRLADSGIVCAKKPVRITLPQKALSRNTSPRSNTRGSSAPVRCDSQSSKIRKPGSPTDVRRKENQSLKNNKYSPAGSSPRNQNLENKRFPQSDVSLNNRLDENQNLKNKKYTQADNSPDNKQSDTQGAGARGYPQPETQGAGARGFPQSDTQGVGGRSFPQPESQGGGGRGFPQPESQGAGARGFPQSDTQGAGGRGFPQSDTQGAGVRGFPQSDTQGAGARGFPQSDTQGAGARGFPQPENQDAGARGFPQPESQGAGARGFPQPESQGAGARGFPQPESQGAGGRGFPQSDTQGVGGRSFPQPESQGAGGRGFPQPESQGAGGRGFPQPETQGAGARGFPQPETQGAGARGFPQSDTQGVGGRSFPQPESQGVGGRGFPQPESQGAGARGFPQSDTQGAGARGFPQSENQKAEGMGRSKSRVDDYNKGLNAGKSQRLSLPGSSHHERKSFHDQHQEKTSFHDHYHESHDEFPEADEKSKDSSCHLSNFKANSDFSCELEKDFDFLKVCCPKAKEGKKNLKLPEIPCLDKENVRNLIKCETNDIEASWQLDSNHKKSHKKPCPKQEKAQLSVKALVQASKAPVKTCPPKYSPLEHPEPDDISPEVAAAMMFSQEQGVKMEECPRDTIALLFPEEPQPPFPVKGSISVVDPNKSGQEDMIEKSAAVPSEGVSDSAYTRTMRRKGEDVTPQRSYDVDFAIGQSKREYVFVTEKPQRVNVVQFRGGSAPAWFPWYFSAFPDDDDGLKLVNSPSGLFYKAWLHSNPKNIPTGDVIVLD